ncbi:hypothetical protein J3F84DRAFT_383503 [Trichoderma pleuroticola]
MYFFGGAIGVARTGLTCYIHILQTSSERCRTEGLGVCRRDDRLLLLPTEPVCMLILPWTEGGLFCSSEMNSCSSSRRHMPALVLPSLLARAVLPSCAFVGTTRCAFSSHPKGRKCCVIPVRAVMLWFLEPQPCNTCVQTKQ